MEKFLEFARYGVLALGVGLGFAAVIVALGWASSK